MAKFRLAERIDAFWSLAERLAWLIWSFVVGGGFAWLAALTVPLKTYSPLSWGVVGLLASLVAAAVYWVFSAARLYSAKRTFMKSRDITLDQVNPLDDTFDKRNVDISLFENPFHEWNENKIFRNCKLYGPATVMLDDAHLDTCSFINCEGVLIKDGVKVKNAIAFRRVHMRDCKLYNLTILVPEIARQTYESIPGWSWITRETNGDR